MICGGRACVGSESCSGGIDKKEFRRGVQALGYEAKPKTIDTIFDDIVGERGGKFIEFDALKRAMRKHRAEAFVRKRHQGASVQLQLPNGSHPPLPTSVSAKVAEANKALSGLSSGEEAGELVVPAWGGHTHT